MAVAPSADAAQLRETLAQYEAQLHQVEAALTNDPESDELLKLKSDLNEVIKLTKDLMELAPQPRKRRPTSDWKTGDVCKAIWSENGKHYDAVIDMLSDDGLTCTVTFDGYGTTDIVRTADLCRRDLGEAGSSSFTHERARTVKQKKADLRDYKKKKALKKSDRMKEISEHRETEKQRWKNFTLKTSKARGGPLSSKQKKSIFAVPDSISGKVGVGTCNMGGKGMTDFSNPKGYMH